MPEHWILYLVIGLASGLLSGTLGLGAGVIMIPALVALAIPQKEAQGIALSVMVPMALMGAVRYKLNPDIEVNMAIVGLLALTAIVGAFAGAGLAAHLSNMVLRKIFAIFLILVGLRMLLTR